MPWDTAFHYKGVFRISSDSFEIVPNHVLSGMAIFGWSYWLPKDTRFYSLHKTLKENIFNCMKMSQIIVVN